MTKRNNLDGYNKKRKLELIKKQSDYLSGLISKLESSDLSRNDFTRDILEMAKGDYIKNIIEKREIILNSLL